MEKVIPLLKQKGQTPLEAINTFKAANPVYQDIKISYAGRLDPMAEGLLLLLIGTENKKRHDYENMKKTYSFSVLFGIGTDSYDILGIPQLGRPILQLNDTQIQKYIKTHTKAFIQPFPPYSSKTINGVPLYKLSREGKLNGVSLPTKKVTVYSFSMSGTSRIKSHDLLTKIKHDIQSVHGDFRQEEILKKWEDLLRDTDLSFPIYEFEVTCSSGTYIRAIAHDMGLSFGTSALAFSILRTAIGEYTLK